MSINASEPQIIRPKIVLPSSAQLFGDSWRLLLAYRQKIFGAALVISAPLVISQVVLDTYNASADLQLSTAALAIVTVFFGVSLVLLIIQNVVMTLMVKDIDQAVTITQTFGQALRLFWSSLLLVIMLSVTVTLGLLLFIIPGIILAMQFSFAFCVLVFEQHRGWGALKRSRQLVRGATGKVFWRYLMLGIAIMLLWILVNLPLSIFAEAGLMSTQVLLYLGTVVGILLNAFVLAITALYTVLLYRALRSQNEANAV